MALLGLFQTHAEKQAERRAGRAENRYNQREATLDDLLGGLHGLAQGAYTDSNQTLQQRYGDSLGQLTDQINADRTGARRSVERALLAGGGDISGSGAAALAGVTQAGNQQLGNVIRQYSDLTQQQNRFDQSRGDQLTLQQLGFNTDLLNLNNNQLLGARRNQAQATQAANQFLGDIIGAGAFATGSALSGPRQ